jgi:hypothetical protein
MCVAMAELPETDTATLNARAEQFEAWCARVLDHLPCMQTLTTAAYFPTGARACSTTCRPRWRSDR